jgi:hypothetical protein
MQVKIDNLDGKGPTDYTSSVCTDAAAKVTRKLNRAAELQISLFSADSLFVVPREGAQLAIERNNGTTLFSGYLAAPPTFEYMGWGQQGPVYRYDVTALSDDMLFDRKRIPDRPTFVDRTAGSIFRELSVELLPQAFDLSAVQDLDRLPAYWADPRKKWSQHAAEIALQAGGSYRALNGALALLPLGSAAYVLGENDAEFSPQGLQLTSREVLVNDLTVAGRVEPGAYVKDYFVGDGYTLRFYLSQTPFVRQNRTLLEEEYAGAALDRKRWLLADPNHAVQISGGKLVIAGGNGKDGETTVAFAEQLELGGAAVWQHGDVSFTAASDGVIGGIYTAGVFLRQCLAGFRITPSGGQSSIQAVVNGAVTGTGLVTVAGHRYVFTTRLYSSEIYRIQQSFHSSLQSSGKARGGGAIAADVRIVLEVHDVDPADPGSLVAPSIVLYDDVITGAPGFCTYALINSANLHCSLAFTRLLQSIDAEVRSALPGQSYRTRLLGSLADGAECLISSDPALQFFPEYAPAKNELIEVHYRGSQRAVARVTDSASIAGLENGEDDGTRGWVCGIAQPPPRTSADCENAALALLDDRTGTAWSGDYEVWSEFLPGGGQDIFPGDALRVEAASRGASFGAIVRQVEVQVADLLTDQCQYKIHFADWAAEPPNLEFETAGIIDPFSLVALDVTQVGSVFLDDLRDAEVTAAASTSVTMDAGLTPSGGGGIEVRWTDYGWGQDNDRNLAGRFAARSFVVPRLSQSQSYYLRQYDASNPAKYSRHTTVLRVDYPL